LQVVVLPVGGGDVLEEDGADDAATAPHEGDGWFVELPLVFAGSLFMLDAFLLVGVECAYLLHEHETLGV
jgi:hypothetical protein